MAKNHPGKKMKDRSTNTKGSRRVAMGGPMAGMPMGGMGKKLGVKIGGQTTQMFQDHSGMGKGMKKP